MRSRRRHHAAGRGGRRSFARPSARRRPAPRAAPACSPASTRTRTGCSGWRTAAGRSTTTATTSCTPCATAGYYSVLIGEQHISKRPGRDRLRPRREIGTHPRRTSPPLTIDLLAEPDAAVLPVRRLLRDPSRVLPADGATRELGAAAAEPARHAGGPAGRGGLQRECALADQGVGTVLERARAARARRQHAGDLHHRSRLAFPGAKTTLTDRGIGVLLIMRGPGGFLGGKVIDAMVSHIDSSRRSASWSASSGPSGCRASRCCRWCAASATRSATRSSPRAPTTLPTSRSARFARIAGSTSAASRPDTPIPANIDDSPSKDYCSSTAGSTEPSTPSSSTTCVFDPERGAQPRRRPSSSMLARLRARLRGVDAGDRRPAARRARAPAAGRGVQRPRPALTGGADAHRRSDEERLTN